MTFLRETPPVSRCRLADLIGHKPLIVYGCGDGYVTFSAFVIRKYDLRPELIIDKRFAQPGMWDGFGAMSPDNFAPSGYLRDEGVVVITAGKPHLQAEMIATSRRLGFRTVILASDIYEYHLSHAPCGFEDQGPQFFRDRSDRIAQAYGRLADSQSREVFMAVLKTHFLRTPLPIPNLPVEHQYLPVGVRLPRGTSRLIHCGAYDGDTLRRLLAFGGPMQAVACFEPDAFNFVRLAQYLGSTYASLAVSVIAMPCGVWHTESLLTFSSGRRINSSLTDTGDTHVQCVAIDHVLWGFRPTYITMDVEGAEPEALRGAEQMLRSDRPDLAICVYHRPEHLWEVLLWIDSLDVGYQFTLRNYTGFPAETVLYATTEPAESELLDSARE